LATVDGAVAALDGVSVVYHLAAALSGAPADMYLNTVVASHKLLEAAAQRPTPPKIVLVSSFGVYGVAPFPKGYQVDESTPLEVHPERRDVYSQAKLRQEKLFWEYAERYRIPLVVLRPGVIYGPGGSAFSVRAGLSLPGVFLYLGGRNLLPLSYVDNCAEAIVVAGTQQQAVGQVYNVHDDNLPTCKQYLQMYEDSVGPVRALPVPYPLLWMGAALVKKYHTWSRGQLPAVFTPYKVAATWKGNTFSNEKLKTLGWRQHVPTEEGLRRTFAYLRNKQRGGTAS
jgi:nucleoside-diphosphate-sugar epimerase